MPLQYTNTNNAIRGLGPFGAAVRQDSQAVIAQLQFADLGRGAGTLHTVNNVRLDLQGRTATHVNLQVQTGAMSVSAALIDLRLLATTDAQNQRGAANSAISALNRSLDSGTVWSVDGTLP